MAMNDTHTPAVDHGFTQDELPGYRAPKTLSELTREGDALLDEITAELAEISEQTRQALEAKRARYSFIPHEKDGGPKCAK